MQPAASRRGTLRVPAARGASTSAATATRTARTSSGYGPGSGRGWSETERSEAERRGGDGRRVPELGARAAGGGGARNLGTPDLPGPSEDVRDPRRRRLDSERQ